MLCVEGAGIEGRSVLVLDGLTGQAEEVDSGQEGVGSVHGTAEGGSVGAGGTDYESFWY